MFFDAPYFWHFPSFYTMQLEPPKQVHKCGKRSRDGGEWLVTALVQTTACNGKQDCNLCNTGSLETLATNDSFLSHACSAADSWSAEDG